MLIWICFCYIQVPLCISANIKRLSCFQADSEVDWIFWIGCLRVLQIPALRTTGNTNQDRASTTNIGVCRLNLTYNITIVRSDVTFLFYGPGTRPCRSTELVQVLVRSKIKITLPTSRDTFSRYKYSFLRKTNTGYLTVLFPSSRRLSLWNNYLRNLKFWLFKYLEILMKSRRIFWYIIWLWLM